MLGLKFYIADLLILLLHYCHALTGNVTIDDTYGDVLTGTLPAYAPDANWKPSPANDMNATRLHYGSTHGLFGTGNISLAFNGTVIYVYFVVDPLAGADISFVLDGEEQRAKRYERKATSGDPVYLYNQLVFASGPLAGSQHNLNVVVTSISIGCLYFDYAIYSSQTSDGDPEANPTRGRISIGAIVGPAVAGALVIALCCWCLFRRWQGRARRRQHSVRGRIATHLSMDMMPTTPALVSREAVTPFTVHPNPYLATPAPKDSFHQLQKASQSGNAGPLPDASSLAAECVRGTPAERGQAAAVDTEPPPY